MDIWGRGPAGGRRGPRGPVGMRGRDGKPGVGSLDLILRWMSRTLLSELRFLEFSCLRIEDPERDLTLGEDHHVKIWHSLSTKSDHAAWGKTEQGATYIKNVAEGGYSLKLTGVNALRIDRISIAPHTPKSVVWFAVNFKCEKFSEKEQIVLSNNCKRGAPRGVSVGGDGETLIIYGGEDRRVVKMGKSIFGKWLSVWVKFVDLVGKYCVRTAEGVVEEHSFSCNPTSPFESVTVDVGGDWIPQTAYCTKGFRGLIASVDLYADRTSADFPEAFLEVITNTHHLLDQ